MIGDKILIKPEDLSTQTPAGLYLPPSVRDKEKVQGGRVVNTGPGYLIPNPDFADEPWKAPGHSVRYIPLQAKTGDYAFFLFKDAIEMQFENEKHMIIAHHHILALLRDQPDETDLYGEIDS